MHHTIKNILELKNNIKQKISELKYPNYEPNIIAVSKTFPIENIKPLIEHNHQHFGENKVQEALSKWKEIKNSNVDIKLHMLGKLQTNKAKQAVEIFDYIHSVDTIRLANKIADEQAKQKKDLKIFLQVNIGDESQKNGVSLNDVNKLAEETLQINLKVIGLMCLPPINEPATKYFSLIKSKNDELNFKDLSLGMSNDYMDALNFRTSFIRIGTKIFGQRG
tara:strand:+ start:141 stop:803 length:663 start_codon:yes stop_codon:yes gene_type:complete